MTSQVNAKKSIIISIKSEDGTNFRLALLSICSKTSIICYEIKVLHITLRVFIVRKISNEAIHVIGLLTGIQTRVLLSVNTQEDIRQEI